MLNYIWAGMILIALFVSIINGTLEETTAAALTGAGDGVTLSIELMGILCFWNGIMKIAEKSGLVEILSKLFSPFYHILFPGLEKKSKAGEYIFMNLSANFLGLGNAATPLGIQAMKELQRANGTAAATNDMIMFVVLNTASFQLIPSTVIALRANGGSVAPAEIIVPVWIASCITIFFAVLYTKLCNRAR